MKRPNVVETVESRKKREAGKEDRERIKEIRRGIGIGLRTRVEEEKQKSKAVEGSGE